MKALQNFANFLHHQMNEFECFDADVMFQPVDIDNKTWYA